MSSQNKIFMYFLLLKPINYSCYKEDRIQTLRIPVKVLPSWAYPVLNSIIPRRTAPPSTKQPHHL